MHRRLAIRKVVRKKRVVRRGARRIKHQKAKPFSEQGIIGCDDCAFVAMNRTGLAAHKRFKHGWKAGEKLPKKVFNVPAGLKTGGAGSSGGADVKGSSSNPAPKTLWDLKGMISAKRALIQRIERDILKLQDIEDVLALMAKS